ncbi:protein FAM3A isoform X7 [Lagenorhynchus albirostris]|uniref:protein FAM3A isoform X7 n=1 Tax=Lagenorhynchus albirostris TaxID=27610 RepID=UPI0028EF0CF8|nr:protein FAM3A isoform X7 [Lagenorhynchus albirostris]
MAGWRLRAALPLWAAIAGPLAPRSGAPSPRVAEQSGAAGLTGLPLTELASPHRQSARSTNAAPDGSPTPAGEVDMRLAGPLRIMALVISVGLTWLVASILLGGPGGGFPRIQQLFASPENSVTAEPRARKYKCGLPQPCPEEHLAFRVVSGAANVIGPKICLEDRMLCPPARLMSSVKDNVGRGLNIALVNDVNDLLKFIRPLHEGTLVFVASYDDPATNHACFPAGKASKLPPVGQPTSPLWLFRED